MSEPAAPPKVISTVYGRFVQPSKRRLDLTYDYEHGQIQAFARMAESFDPVRIIDVGANIGVYAVMLSSLPSVEHIHTFEPSSEAADILRSNVALQDRPERFEMSELALSDAAGTVEFASYGAMAGNNAILSTDPMAGDGATSITVATERWDAVMRATDERFVAKIDVEGHESQVIRGAAEFLTGNVGILQVESFDENAAALRDELERLGYVPAARMAFDRWFTNGGDDVVDEIREMVDEVTAAALVELQELRSRRRNTLRTAKKTLESVRFEYDPVTGPR